MQNSIIIFIHLMAAGIAVGSIVFGIFLLLPAVEKLPAQETPEEHSMTYKVHEILAPTVFTCVVVLIGTGIYFLLENYTKQMELKSGYYDLFGIKMVFVVTTFFLSIYQTFTLRTRIANLDLSPENRKLVPSTLKTMKILSHTTLASISAAVFLGVWLARF